MGEGGQAVFQKMGMSRPAACGAGNNCMKYTLVPHHLVDDRADGLTITHRYRDPHPEHWLCKGPCTTKKKCQICSSFQILSANLSIS